VNGIGDQLSQIVMGEGRKYDVLHYRSSFADRFELAHQWMGGIDFVVAIGSDQQQMPHIHLSQQILEQIECRRSRAIANRPGTGERMFRPCEYADESPEHQLEAALRVLCGRSGTGGCSPMMSFNSGTRSTMRRPFGPTASRMASRQLLQLCFVLTQERTDKTLKGLRQRGVWDVALVLVKFA
jgi:hypothetical protein